MSKIYKTTMAIGNTKGEEEIPKGQYIEVTEFPTRVLVSFQSKHTKKVENKEYDQSWLNRCLEQNVIIEEEQKLGYTASELRVMMEENNPREDIVIEILNECYEAMKKDKTEIEVEYKFVSKKSLEWVKEKLIEYRYEVEESSQDRHWKRANGGVLEPIDGMKYKLVVKW